MSGIRHFIDGRLFGITLYKAVTFNFPQTLVTKEERDVKQKIETMLQNMYEDKYEIEEEYSLDFDNSFVISEVETVIDEGEVEEETEEASGNKGEATSFAKETICVNDDISIEYKRRAVDFWKLIDSARPRTFKKKKFHNR